MILGGQPDLIVIGFIADKNQYFRRRRPGGVPSSTAVTKEGLLFYTIIEGIIGKDLAFLAAPFFTLDKGAIAAICRVAFAGVGAVVE